MKTFVKTFVISIIIFIIMLNLRQLLKSPSDKGVVKGVDVQVLERRLKENCESLAMVYNMIRSLNYSLIEAEEESKRLNEAYEAKKETIKEARLALEQGNLVVKVTFGDIKHLKEFINAYDDELLRLHHDRDMAVKKMRGLRMMIDKAEAELENGEIEIEKFRLVLRGRSQTKE